MRPVLPLLAFPIVGFLGAIPYIFLIGRVLGRGDLALVAAIVVLPIFATVCGVIWWLSLGFLERRGEAWSGGKRLLLAAVVALLAGIVLAGPRGFTLAGGSELVNWALLLVVSAGALLYGWMTRGGKGGTSTPDLPPVA